MDPTMLPRCLIPLMYGRALVMRCRAIGGCSQVGRAGGFANLEIVADMGRPPASRFTGGKGRPGVTSTSGPLRAPVDQYAVVELGVRELLGGRARVEEGRVAGLQLAEVVEGLVVVVAERDEGEEHRGVGLRGVGEGLRGRGLGVGGAVGLEDDQGR